MGIHKFCFCRIIAVPRSLNNLIPLDSVDRGSVGDIMTVFCWIIQFRFREWQKNGGLNGGLANSSSLELTFGVDRYCQVVVIEWRSLENYSVIETRSP